MQQDYAEVVGVIVVSGLDAAQTDELTARIKAQPVTATNGWGEPVPWRDGLAVQLRRGPMLGAWPADIRRTVRQLVGDVGTVRIETTRTVLAKRADYDAGHRTLPATTPKPRPDMTPEAQTTYDAMGSPKVTRSEDAQTLVKVKDETWAIYPDGLVQSPREGRPVPLDEVSGGSVGKGMSR